jgi:hypothetical protein
MTSTDQDVHKSHSKLDSVNSSLAASISSMISSTKQGKRVRPQYTGWTFQLIFSAETTTLNEGRASNNMTLQERQNLLLEQHEYKSRHRYFG